MHEDYPIFLFPSYEDIGPASSTTFDYRKMSTVPNPGGDVGPSWKRRRPATACNQCRKRKIRCDGVSPSCGPCSKPPRRPCEYAASPFYESRKDDFSPSGLPAFPARDVMPKPLPHDFTPTQDLDIFAVPPEAAFSTTHLNGSISSYFPENDLHMMPAMAGSCPPSDIPIPSPALTNAPSLSSGASTYTHASPRRSNSPSYGSISACSEFGATLEPPKPGNMLDMPCGGEESDWPDLLEHCEKLQFVSHGLGGSTNLPPNQERLRPILDRFTKLERHHTQQERRLSVQTSNNAGELLPPRITCDHLIESYINTFETVLRILHIPTFSREYEAFWRNSTSSRATDSDDPMACKLMVILALGSTVVLTLHGNGGPAEDRAYLQKSVPMWISYAKQWLTRRMPSAQRSDLNIAQIICLLELVRHVHADDGAGAGALVQPGDYDIARIGMQMNLHRDPSQRHPNMPLKEVEMRRRLWATMVELSLQRSLDEDLPATLMPDSYDCLPPSNMLDEELEGNGAGRPTSRDLTPSSVLVLLSQTQRLRLKCVHLINSPAAPKTHEDAHALAWQLASACSSNIDALRRMSNPPSDFQIQLLQTYTRQFLRALHEPFANMSHTSGHYSRKMRTEVGARIIGYPPSLALVTTADAETMMDARPQATLTEGRADACVALRVFSQGYIGRVQRHAAISMCLDLIYDLEANAFPATDGACWRRILNMIRDTVSVFERRVRVSKGSYSTRELVFLVSAEAYIGALLRGCQPSEADELIARAANTALLLCCDVIERNR